MRPKKNIKTAVGLVAIVVLGLNLSMPNATAQTVFIRPGFYDGNAYLQLSLAQQVAYISGVVDGIYLVPVFNAEHIKIERLHRCIEGMGNSQICAIVNKFLQNNPTRWHEPMNNLVYSALVKACGLKW
jgi:hypothetical protein